MSEDVETSLSLVPKLDPIQVIYCGVTGLPAEYCEFSDKYKESIEWFRKNHPELMADVAPNESGEVGVEKKLEEVSVAAESKKPKKTKAKKEAEPKIVLQLVNRGGRKHVTVITGLESFGIDLKKAAKTLANKFACGSSVSKTPAGGQEIVIQGDFCDDLMEFIPETWDMISEDDIDIIEEKKGKR